MNTTDRKDITKELSSAMYQVIRATGLYKVLTGAEWDTLADRLGAEALAKAEVFCEGELERIEAERMAA